MKTTRLFTEIPYNMSPTGNIKLSLERFGIENDTKTILVVAFD